ncbi:hypothetical protein NQ315_000140, partial [Exocentrus adspersus]
NMFGILVLCFCALFGQLNASAIPMWEFLSKQEKTSFLYSLFANQVDSFCDTATATVKNCNQELLKYGLTTLKNMPEDVLDATDPYQRNANTIIWQTLMKGHPLAYSAPKFAASSSTAKPNSYDDDESAFGEDESYGDFGSLPSASAKIDNVYVVPPPKGFVQYPHNVANFLQAVNGPVMDKEAFEKMQREYTASEGEPVTGVYIPEVPFRGAVEVKVYPDGRPVEEKLPQLQDEDLRQYKMSKVPIPNL